MLAKRFLFPCALCVAVLALLAGQVSAETAPAMRVLRVGTSGDYTPFSFRDADGQLAGFDVSLARRLATDLGRAVQFVSFRWSDLVAQLDQEAFDVAMSGVTVRADRAVHGVFSRPYVVTGAVAVIRAADRHSVHRIADLDRPGVRIAVNGGGHLEQVARGRFARAQLTPVADNAALVGLLRGGSVDAVVSEELEARTWPANAFVILGPFTRDRKAYLAPRGATDLVRQINDWLAARESDGWLNEQRRIWFGKREWTPEQATFEALTAALDLRLQLMPLVSAVKRRDHLPIADPAQERRVLDRVATAAAAAGLNPDDVAGLFRVQMELAKAVERRSPSDEGAVNQSLADLRIAVSSISDEVLAELVRVQSSLADAHLRSALDATVRSGLSASGLSSEMKAQLLEAIHRCRSGYSRR